MNVFLFFVLVLFWGCSFFAIHKSLLLFPPFMGAFARTSITLLVLLLWFAIRKRRFALQKKQVFHHLGLGLLLFGFPWACLFWGEQFVHPSIAAIINSTVPLFVLILSWILLPNERASVPAGVGVFLGVFGMAFVFLPGTDWSLLSASKLGMISIFAMAVFYSFGAVLMKRVGKDVDRLWAFAVQLFSGAVFLAMATVLRGERIDHSDPWVPALLGIGYLAVFSTAIATAIYYHLLFQWSALKVAAVTYLTPLVAITMDFVFLSVIPEKNELLGGGLIVIGVLLIHGSHVWNQSFRRNFASREKVPGPRSMMVEKAER